MHAFSSPEEVVAALLERADGGPLGLALDYDGCLAEIAPTPEAALLPAETRALLQQLAGRADVRVGIVTGRARESLLEVLDGAIAGVDLATHGGMRIDGPQGEWIHPGAAAVAAEIDRLAERLTVFAQKWPGALVENKRFAIAVHYRLAPDAAGPLREEVERELASANAPLRFIYGKAVYELQPDVPWDKGAAVETLLDRWRVGRGALFVGDDAIDEPGFCAVKARGGVACRIGAPTGPTEATFTLRDPAACRRLLAVLAS